MRRTSIVRDSTFLAIALGLAVFSTSTTPAAALSLSQINLGQHAPVANGNTVASNQLPNKGGLPAKPQLPQQTNQAPINQIINSGPLKPIGPVANSGNPSAPVKPPFHICPLDRPCPPLPTPTGNNGNGNGNGTNTGSNGTNTGSNGNGSGTNVSINLPPVVIGRPQPVYVAPQPVYIQRPQYPMPTQMPTVSRPTMVQSQPMAQAPMTQAPVTQVNTAATQPTNCLTKQYLSDGSALFSDVCTGETAMATQAQLQAEAQARTGQPVAQPQVSTN